MNEIIVDCTHVLCVVDIIMECEDLVQFWEQVPVTLDQLRRYYATDDVGLAERLALRAEETAYVLRAFYGRVYDYEVSNGPVIPGGLLAEDLLLILGDIVRYTEHYTDITSAESGNEHIFAPTCPVEYRNTPGRPPFHIEESQIEAMMEMGFKYEDMAMLLGVSSRTLRRRREQLGLPLRRYYSEIPDSDLDAEIVSILGVSHYYWTGGSFPSTVAL